MNGQPQQIQIKAKDDDLKGTYSNLAYIGHAKEEFILDFLLNAPPGSILVSRIIMSPGHLKRLITALQESVGKYEAKFSKIEEAKTPEMPEGGMGFKVDK